MAGLILIGSVLALLAISWVAGWRALRRGILAVLAGYAALIVPFVLLINLLGDAVFSPEAQVDARLILLLAGLGMVGLLGGFVTARVARERPHVHAAGLAAFLTAFAAISFFSAPAGEPRWTRIVVQGVMVPAVLLGGALWSRVRERNGAVPSEDAE